MTLQAYLPEDATATASNRWGVGAVSVQIFLSYARIDDELPSNVTDGKGFVTFLYQELLHQFRQSGEVDTIIWRDTRNVDAADQFDKVIEDAIDASAVLLVVLSPNWMSRPYCRRELDRFRERWKHLGPEKLKHRIILASKRFVEPDRRPSLLQGQVGHEFFVFDGPEKTGLQFEFFQRGKPRDDRYYEAAGRLATSLSLRAQGVIRNREIAERTEDEQRAVGAGSIRFRPPVDTDARKVYLAKPASDMREAYSRLVQELSHNGYAIVPDPDQAIPHDDTATAFIDTAMSEADVSIHLLGEGSGYAPESSEPIARLQLARAAARLPEAAGDDAKARPPFRRIIWAPEAIEDGEAFGANGKPADDGAAKAAAKARLPLDVLARFGAFMASDKVVGGTPSKFVDFLIEHLRQSDPQASGAAAITEDDWIYVYHDPADTAYACDLMDALKQRGVIAGLPAFEGDPADVNRLHQERLSECSAVVLCWAQATEAWAHARAHELKDWKKLGRQKKFAYRGLLAGPPPGVRKTVFVKYPPANEIDVVVNLSDDSRPLTEAIDGFIRLAPSHAR